MSEVHDVDSEPVEGKSESSANRYILSILLEVADVSSMFAITLERFVPSHRHTKAQNTFTLQLPI